MFPPKLRRGRTAPGALWVSAAQAFQKTSPASGAWCHTAPSSGGGFGGRSSCGGRGGRGSCRGAAEESCDSGRRRIEGLSRGRGHVNVVRRPLSWRRREGLSRGRGHVNVVRRPRRRESWYSRDASRPSSTEIPGNPHAQVQGKGCIHPNERRLIVEALCSWQRPFQPGLTLEVSSFLGRFRRSGPPGATPMAHAAPPAHTAAAAPTHSAGLQSCIFGFECMCGVSQLALAQGRCFAGGSVQDR